MNDVEIFQAQPQLKLPTLARESRLPGRYNELYQQLIQQSLMEFPPIEGYETTHVLLIERLAYFFAKQKQDESEPVQTFDLRRYKSNVSAFLRTIEALLREARSISAETTFKHNFVRQVVEVIDRTLPNTDQKRLVVQELAKLAAS